jgi:hypothetical protein
MVARATSCGVLALLAAIPSAQALRGNGTPISDTERFGATFIDPDDGSKMFCSGAIISSQHILTAASCFLDVRDGRSAIIRRGGLALVGMGQQMTSLDPKVQQLEIAHVSAHPSFTPDNWRHHKGDLVDLAVVRLKKHIEMGEDHNSQIVVLVNQDPEMENDFAMLASSDSLLKNVMVSGFGTKQGRYQKSLVNFLPEVLESDGQRTREECEPDVTKFEPGDESDFDPYYHYCAARENSNNMLCPEVGDLGAPLSLEIQLADPRMSQQRVNFLLGIYAGDGAYLYSTADPRDALVGTWDDRESQCTSRQSVQQTRRNFDRFIRVERFGTWIQEHTATILPHRYFPQMPSYEDLISILSPSIGQPGALPAEIMREQNWKQSGSFLCAPDDCGKKAKHQRCWCDLDCTKNGDCCSNFAQVCQRQQSLVVRPPGSCALPDKTTACGSKVATQAGENFNAACWCDKLCEKNEDCCADYPTVCGVTLAESYKQGSCKNNCGKKAGDCWCDSNCQTNGDCCPDVGICHGTTAPGSVNNGSCRGNCGHNSGLCWCDPGCTANGDCCADFVHVCSTEPSTCKGRCGHDVVNPDGTTCWCDDQCTIQKPRDCCSDHAAFCGIGVVEGR